MIAFVSHNKNDIETARLLAVALVEHGVGVWFDEWNLRPGDSIVGGIERGLQEADVFILVWSANAAQSAWVGDEVRAYLHRRIADRSLKVIPLMHDGTSLPTLVADFKGFRLGGDVSVSKIAFEIAGCPLDGDLVRRLRKRLEEIVTTPSSFSDGDPFPYRLCPTCGSEKLSRSSAFDDRHDELHYFIGCDGCGWRESMS